MNFTNTSNSFPYWMLITLLFFSHKTTSYIHGFFTENSLIPRVFRSVRSISSLPPSTYCLRILYIKSSCICTIPALADTVIPRKSIVTITSNKNIKRSPLRSKLHSRSYSIMFEYIILCSLQWIYIPR